MNQGRIWCVVNPTVGLPLFLGSVAVTSLIVHACLLTNTPWFGKYWAGKDGKVAANEAPATNVAAVTTDPAFTITVTPTLTADGGNGAFTITVAPRAVAPLAMTTPQPERLALATPASE